MENTTRQPKPGTVTFRVRLRGVPRFRRCGIEFNTSNTPLDVSAADLSEAQRIELVNTPTLDVEESAAPATVAAPTPKAPEKKAAEGGK